MTLDEIEAVLDEALAFQFPRFHGNRQPRQRIEALEDHMLSSAYLNGKLVECRHWLREVRTKLAEDWERLEGWEVATTKPRGRLTAADIQRAKLRVAPAAYEAGRKAKRLAESVDDQIIRLEREEKVCSRAYTMIAGQ